MTRIETLEQFNARHLAALPQDSWERERIEWLERQLAERDAEIARLRSEGVPGVMHEVDKSFYDLAIAERNFARTQVVNRDTTIAQLQYRLERLEDQEPSS
jgi:hypothetical protein